MCKYPHCNTLQHTATHCNTLQHTATHCNTLQHSTTHAAGAVAQNAALRPIYVPVYSLQHAATHCNTLQHAATHCNTLQYTATHRNTLQHTATHCNTRNRCCCSICGAAPCLCARIHSPAPPAPTAKLTRNVAMLPVSSAITTPMPQVCCSVLQGDALCCRVLQ